MQPSQLFGCLGDSLADLIVGRDHIDCGVKGSASPIDVKLTCGYIRVSSSTVTLMPPESSATANPNERLNVSGSS